MVKQIRPVGEPIELQRSSEPPAEVLRRQCGGHPVLVESGTAALALALLAAKSRAGVARPNVVIPAYACPDLVSAADYAGVAVRLVDLEPGRPWMALDGLNRAIDEATVAVVAVNFLGIPERLERIRECIGDRPVTLIDDCAQTVPVPHGPAYDFRILSFGKGKPVGLLHGGALLAADRERLEAIAERVASPGEAGLADRPEYAAKALLYNRLLQPAPYWVLNRVPFLGIGRTEYKPLHGIRAMNPAVAEYLPANLAAYRRRPLAVQQSWRSLLAAIDGVEDLARCCGLDAGRRLLRYPVLMPDAAAKRACLRRLQRLGVSGLYPAVLPDIDGVVLDVDRGGYPNAVDFSRRLLTLPTHTGIAEHDRLTIAESLEHFSNPERRPASREAV